jgi:tRNA (cytosine38-C5)-methyltransferase
MNSNAAWGAHTQYGLSGPITGPLFSDVVVESGGVIGPAASLVMAEAEYGFRFAASPVATGAGGAFVADDIVAALNELVVCIEMCGTRFTDAGSASICQKLADHALNTGVVTGAAFPVGEHPGQVSVETLRALGDRVVAIECNGATASGSLDALQQLVYLANHLAARGKCIRTGDLIISGATGVLKGGATFAAGSDVTATFPSPVCTGPRTISVACTTSAAAGVTPGLVAIEFFSGVGGLHCGLSAARPDARVVAAFDVNPNANSVYAANFPATKIVRSDVKRATAKQLAKHGADAWLMSPPCQPFSRNGKGGDVRDPRCAGFVNLIHVLDQMQSPPRYFFMENVEGFETSECCLLLRAMLARRGYVDEAYVLSPHSFGIPNLRDRAFFLAERVPDRDRGAASGAAGAAGAADSGVESSAGAPAQVLPIPPAAARADAASGFSALPQLRIHRRLASDNTCREVTYVDGTCEMGTAASEALWTRLNAHCRPIRDFLESHDASSAAALAVPAKVIDSPAQASAIDVVAAHCVHSSCFTKGYMKFTVGTGSVLQTVSPPLAHPIARDSAALRKAALRYFSPREIANLHGFPRSFKLGSVSAKQQYKLLGNSLSVTVVQALLAHLFSGNVVRAASSKGAGKAAHGADGSDGAQPLAKKART